MVSIRLEFGRMLDVKNTQTIHLPVPRVPAAVLLPAVCRLSGMSSLKVVAEAHVNDRQITVLMLKVLHLSCSC